MKDFTVRIHDKKMEEQKEHLASLGNCSVLFKRSKANFKSHFTTTEIQILPNGTRCSPPTTPLVEVKHFDNQESCSDVTVSGGHTSDILESELSNIHSAEHYAEQEEVYKMKYSYLKSWPGLLRLLAGLELLFGGMVFACVCGSIQRDSEWSNYYRPNYGFSDVYGYRYNGPMTVSVLVFGGLAWILTVVLLALGLTMYYRTILLDSKWWPLTEASVNLVLGLLYLSAGIVYVNYLNRGGLCFMSFGNNPLLSQLCRVEGGQMAGTAFIFINMLLYLMSFLVGLRMWRHEADRRWKELKSSQVQTVKSTLNMGSLSTRSKRISFRDEQGQCSKEESRLVQVQEEEDQVFLTGSVPGSVLSPKPRIIADYVIKYPEILSIEEKEQYKAVFNDQYPEYKDLHREIAAALVKFQEMDDMKKQLISNRSDAEARRGRYIKPHQDEDSSLRPTLHCE